MGLDWAGEAMRLGVTGGYSHMKADVDARGSSGKADSYHLGAYAGGQWDGVALRNGLAYSWHNIRTTRTIGFAGFSGTATAAYHGTPFHKTDERRVGKEV